MEGIGGNIDGLENFIDVFSSVLTAMRNSWGIEMTEVQLETTVQRLEEAVGTLTLLAADRISLHYRQELNMLIRTVRRIVTKGNFRLQQHRETGPENLAFSCVEGPPTGVGRPSIVIKEEQIEFLRSLHFTWKRIAELLGVSESTLKRRRQSAVNETVIRWTHLSGIPSKQCLCFSFNRYVGRTIRK